MYVSREEEKTIPIKPDDELEFINTLTRQALRKTGMHDLRRRIKALNPELDRRMVRDLARVLHKEAWDKRDLDMIRQSKARLPYMRKKGSNTLAAECGIFGVERTDKNYDERLTGQTGGGIPNDSTGRVRNIKRAGADVRAGKP